MSIATDDNRDRVYRFIIWAICIIAILYIFSIKIGTEIKNIECPQGYTYIIPNVGVGGCYAFVSPVKKPIQP